MLPLVLSSHSRVFEPPGLWQTRLDATFRDRAPRIERIGGADQIVVEADQILSGIGLISNAGARFAAPETISAEGRFEDVHRGRVRPRATPQGHRARWGGRRGPQRDSEQGAAILGHRMFLSIERHITGLSLGLAERHPGSGARPRALCQAETHRPAWLPSGTCMTACRMTISRRNRPFDSPPGNQTETKPDVGGPLNGYEPSIRTRFIHTTLWPAFLDRRRAAPCCRVERVFPSLLGSDSAEARNAAGRATRADR